MADDKTPGAAPDPTPAAPSPAAPLPAPIAEGLDETVPGGRYRTQSGDWVDAEGNPIKEAKKR